jgi:multidrug transporter EmrE-like cation transporter
MINSLIIGLILSLNDIISFSLTKYLSLHKFNQLFIIIPAIMYSFQIPIFYYGLSNCSMVVLNIIWNLMSSILVSIIGTFYFKEKISLIKKIAIIIGILSLILFSID